ncbi:MAG: hypothetical protein EAX96_15380 [Candidatus Lokiarchaeota archaeon]|nr:hypothetical protein [Candidatus Lokiarchaeota archaeon]
MTIVDEIKSEINDLIEQNKPGVVVGLGSEFRSDGVTPINITSRISNILPKTFLKVLPLAIGGEQHFFPDIKAFKPEYLIIIDMANLGKPPGSLAVIKKNILLSGENPGIFSKEKEFSKNLEAIAENIKIVTIGIQAKSIEFGVEQSPELEKAENEVIKILEQVGVYKPKE